MSKSKRNMSESVDDHILSNLLKPSSECVDLSQTQKFLLGDECEAHLWTSDVVGKYIAIAMELPQYRSAAHINSVNGAKFVTLLHEDDVKEAFSLNSVDTNPLHVYKILSFSSNLREKILNNAVEKLPTHFHVWSCAHLAGWLEYAHKVPSCAIEVLKRRICGNDVISKTVVELGKLFQLCDSDESSIAIDALSKYSADCYHNLRVAVTKPGKKSKARKKNVDVDRQNVSGSVVWSYKQDRRETTSEELPSHNSGAIPKKKRKETAISKRNKKTAQLIEQSMSEIKNSLAIPVGAEAQLADMPRQSPSRPTSLEDTAELFVLPETNLHGKDSLGAKELDESVPLNRSVTFKSGEIVGPFVSQSMPAGGTKPILKLQHGTGKKSPRKQSVKANLISSVEIETRSSASQGADMPPAVPHQISTTHVQVIDELKKSMDLERDMFKAKLSSMENVINRQNKSIEALNKSLMQVTDMSVSTAHLTKQLHVEKDKKSCKGDTTRESGNDVALAIREMVKQSSDIIKAQEQKFAEKHDRLSQSMKDTVANLVMDAKAERDDVVHLLTDIMKMSLTPQNVQPEPLLAPSGVSQEGSSVNDNTMLSHGAPVTPSGRIDIGEHRTPSAMAAPASLSALDGNTGTGVVLVTRTAASNLVTPLPSAPAPSGVAAKLRETVREGTQLHEYVPTASDVALKQSGHIPSGCFSKPSFSESIARHPIYLALARHSQTKGGNDHGEIGLRYPSNNLSDSLKLQATKEIDVWVRLVEKYINPNAVLLSNSNKEYQMLRIANVWISLGLLLMNDYEHVCKSVTSSEDSISKPQSESTLDPVSLSVNTIGVKSGVEPCDVTELHDAVRVVMNCAKTIVCNLLQKELIVEYNSVRKHKYMLAVCVVFVLSIIRKLLIKYNVPVGVQTETTISTVLHSNAKHRTKNSDGGTEQIQLMHLFRKLNKEEDVGMPLPALELSRDDMRYLLENTLNVHLLGWEQFDAIFHRMDSCNKGFILPLYVVHTFVFVHPLHKQIATSSLVLTAPSKSNISRSNRFIKKKYDDGPEAHENKTSLPTVNNCKSSASAIALGVKKSSACVSSNSVSNDANLQLLFSSVAPDSIASDSTSTASIPLQIILVMFSLISDYTTLSSTVTDASVNGDPHQAYIRDLFSSIIIENCDNVLSFSKYLKTESNATYDKNESTTPANVADELWINDVQFIGDLLYHCMLLKPIQDRIINYCKEMHVDSKLKRKSKISKSYCDAVDAKEVTLLDINHMVDRNAYYNTKGLKTISISMLYLLQSNNLYNTCQSVAKGLHIFDYSNHHMDASALNIKSKGAMDSKAMEGALSSLSSFVILVSTFSKYRQFALQYHYNEVVYHFLRHKQAFHSKLKELESDLDVHENSMQSVHNTSIGATVETQLEELQSQLMHFEQMKRHCVLQTKILKKEYEISIKKVKGMLTSVLNLHDSICYYNKFKPFIHPSAMTFANQYDDNNSTSEVTETANKVNSSDKVVEASSDSSSLNMIVNGSENDVTSDAHKEINATPTQSVSCLYKMQSNISKQLEEMEDTLMSLLGLPLPVPMIDSQTYPTSNSKINANITLLYRLMMSIEKMLKYTDASNERINRTDGLLSPGKPADGVGATITLKNKSNDTMLQKNDLNKSHTVSTTGNINVIRNVNDLMQLQRIQQITLFLEYNEKKAVKKKKLLVATLELFEAAAKLKNKDSRIRASQHLEMNFNNLFEIEEYANNIKETVLEDMKHDAVIATGKSLDMNVSYTKIQQLSQRVKSYMVAYRKGLIKELDNHDAGTGTSGVPPDTCGTFMSANDTKYKIGSALQEIENVQGCIEIANRDILKTLSNIYTLIHLDK